MHPGVPLSFALVAASAAVAVAATEPAPETHRTPTVSELVVTPEKLLSELDVVAPKRCLPPKREPGAPTPKVVSTFPPQGGKVRPGLLIVRVTFDQPMSCSGFLARDAILPDPCPGGRQEIRQSYDRQTIWTVCLLQPRQQFGLWLNPNRGDAGEPQNTLFQSLSGRPVAPFRLVFGTTDGPLIATAADAVAQDPETAARWKP
jgi:hypothetical protein